MPLSLYHRLDLNKLTPTEISLQMADKSTPIPIGICEDVPIVVCLLFLEDPFLNTAGAVIDCTKGNVTFHVNGNEHTVHFPKKQPQVHSINSIGKIPSIIFGVLNFLYLLSRRNMIFLLLGMSISPLR